jgi:hypothetical protein
LSPLVSEKHETKGGSPFFFIGNFDFFEGIIDFRIAMTIPIELLDGGRGVDVACGLCYHIHM